MFPVSRSPVPLEFDTLPALKVRHWYPARQAPRLYTLARCYLLGDTLQLSLAAFERTPPPTSRLSFAAGAGDTLLLARLGPHSAQLFLCGAGAQNALWADAPGDTLPLEAPVYFAGADEQGWYWGARLALPQAALAGAGIAGAPAFPGAVFRHSAAPGPFGASCLLADAAVPLDAACFDTFEIVDY